MTSRLFPFFILLISLLTACNKDGVSPAEALPGDTWFPLKINGVDLSVQLALTPAEQQRGLMYRDSLDPEGGMIFAYRDPQRMSFWMANTRIPLDIGFFDEKGVLLEIHQLIPFDTKSISSQTDAALFAIETNRGWYASKGLYPGAKIDMKLLAEALQQRGMDPERYRITDY
ncbi:MAG: DUF192 domain-containing protein [Puniceicoccaceae bacterium]